MPHDGGSLLPGAGDPTAGEAVGHMGGDPQRPAWLAALGLGSPGRPLLHQLGLGAWSLLGIIGLTAVAVLGLATVSSVVLPMLFAMVLAVVFRPLGARLERRGVPPSLAAGIVVLGLVALCIAVVVLTVRGVISQTDLIVDEVEEALVELDVEEDAVEEARTAVELGLPLVLTLVVVTFVGGFIPYSGAVVGGALAVAIALGSSGLGEALVMLAVALTANLVIENVVEPAVTG